LGPICQPSTPTAVLPLYTASKMLIPLTLVGPMVTNHLKATVLQVTASMLMTVNGMAGWEPWPSSKASFDGNVTVPSGRPARKSMLSDFVR